MLKKTIFLIYSLCVLGSLGIRAEENMSGMQKSIASHSDFIAYDTCSKELQAMIDGSVDIFSHPNFQYEEKPVAGVTFASIKSIAKKTNENSGEIQFRGHFYDAVRNNTPINEFLLFSDSKKTYVMCPKSKKALLLSSELASRALKEFMPSVNIAELKFCLRPEQNWGEDACVVLDVLCSNKSIQRYFFDKKSKNMKGIQNLADEKAASKQYTLVQNDFNDELELPKPQYMVEVSIIDNVTELKDDFFALPKNAIIISVSNENELQKEIEIIIQQQYQFADENNVD